MNEIKVSPPTGLREQTIIFVNGKAHWLGYSEVRRNSILTILGCHLTWLDKLLLWLGFELTWEVA